MGEMSSCPSLPRFLNSWWCFSMPLGQPGHPWVLTWLFCSLLHAQLTGFASLWLSFSMLTVKLESGVRIKQRSHRKQNLPGWCRVSFGNCPEADKRPFPAGPTGTSLAAFQVTGPRKPRLRASCWLDPQPQGNL